MPLYPWKNTKTGEEVELLRSMAESDIPPNDDEGWERVYSFGLGRIEGAGGSPPRVSK